MKVSLICTLFTPGTLANIIFPYVQPTCNYNEHACLRGQVCLHNGTCISEAAAATYNNTISPVNLPRQAASRADGRCGEAFDGATCDPGGAYGGCCSMYGYCGKTPDHCLVINGCQSGCTSDVSTTTASTPQEITPAVSSAGTQATKAAVSNSEPVIGPATSTQAGAAATGKPTTNGTCGASNGNTVNYGRGQSVSVH